MTKTGKLKISAAIASVAFGTVLYFRIRKHQQKQLSDKLLSLLMLKLNPETKGLSAQTAFDINYAQRVLSTRSGTIIVLKETTAKRFAAKIHSGFGSWYKGDNEERIYNVFRTLKDKVQVSQVAKAYQELYDINLIEKLQKRFDKQEIKKVLAIVDPLDDYRIV
ncbi:hypothetical protein [Aquimarina longa]|uniref:hypothetical protein n=1 Tax=Aquimarina longa TaxID=1080221 RepID=UPI0007838FF0|nr:hypothetical protein [Aquimarina longa]